MHWEVLNECLLRLLDYHAIAMLGHSSKDHVWSTILDYHIWLNNLTTLREYALIHLIRMHPKCGGMLVDRLAPLIMMLDLDWHHVIL